ncbi:MAG: PD-(D/E)XK nuclease family protein [Bacteroidota bacterium]|nr:PD-(D/E)XK nuclease family protein [Bacteroidota bacterium]
MPTPRSSREFDPSPTAVADVVPEILQQVDDAREDRQENCVRFLEYLAPHLQEVGRFEREYKYQLAPRFNTFNYLRDDELGLSRIIADLLDPLAEHGQGTSFLEKMLNVFPETRGWLDELHSAVAEPIRVEKERWIPEGGRIDIIVDIPLSGGRYCLAFENKPYAHDLGDQIFMYLRYLRKQYRKRFLLVYLPPVYRWPDEISFPKAERKKWQGHLNIMPYIGEDTSLEKWFAACQKVCRAQRVRWFLKDAQTFCQQQFGKTSMSDNPDVRFVQKYLSENPSQLRAALAVHDAWIPVRDDVCNQFLKHLKKTANFRLKKLPSDCNVQCYFGEEKQWRNFLWISKDEWMRYEHSPSPLDQRIQIRLEPDGRGPNNWFWGIRSPKPLEEMSKTERERRQKLSIALKREGLIPVDNNSWWLQWKYLSSYRNWDPIVPELFEECEKGEGPITDHCVAGLLELVQRAIPAIDEVETAKQANSSE